jgi:UDPglucose 6-dehydrogenase
MSAPKRVVVVGLWHLGSVNAVGFCEKGYAVTGIEPDAARLASFRAGKAPLFEPGLDDALKKHIASGALTFASSFEAVAEADYFVIAYDSPVDANDAVDITPVVEAAKNAAPYLRPATPVVVTSQVPLGSCAAIEAQIEKANAGWKSGIVYTPENLRLGQAIGLFLEPDMLVFGTSKKAALDAALALYEPFVTEKVPMDLKSAEMVKHALNTFLATSITFINEIAAISKRLGADSVQVGKALKLDKRIGKKALLMPGLGFSGGTLARDVRQLQKFASELGHRAPLLDAIFTVNEGTFDEVVAIVRRKLGALKGRTIGILGLTYKAGTSTVRQSPALKVIARLTSEDATCLAYDPQADPAELAESALRVERVASIDDVTKRAEALVLLTEWPEFRDYDYTKVAAAMKTPIVVDAKNILDPARARAAGIDYEGFGR